MIKGRNAIIIVLPTLHHHLFIRDEIGGRIVRENKFLNIAVSLVIKVITEYTSRCEAMSYNNVTKGAQANGTVQEFMTSSRCVYHVLILNF